MHSIIRGHVTKRVERSVTILSRWSLTMFLFFFAIRNKIKPADKNIYKMKGNLENTEQDIPSRK